MSQKKMQMNPKKISLNSGIAKTVQYISKNGTPNRDSLSPKSRSYETQKETH